MTLEPRAREHLQTEAGAALLFCDYTCATCYVHAREDEGESVTVETRPVTITSHWHCAWCGARNEPDGGACFLCQSGDECPQTSIWASEWGRQVAAAMVEYWCDLIDAGPYEMAWKAPVPAQVWAHIEAVGIVDQDPARFARAALRASGWRT